MNRRIPTAPRVLGVLLLVSTLQPTTALAADGKVKVLVLQTESEKLSKAERSAAADALRSALKGYDTVEVLPPPSSDLIDLMVELECTDIDDACLVRVGKKQGADQLVYTAVKPSGGKLSVELKIIDVAKGTVLKAGDGTAGGAADVGKALLALWEKGGLTVPKPKPTVVTPPKLEKLDVTLTSNVPGAEVWLNKVKVGTTPRTLHLKRGRYTARVVKKGYDDLVKKIVVTGDEPMAVVFTLVETKVAKKVEPKITPTPPTPPTTPPPIVATTPFYKTWWFWTAIGVGVAGIVTTAVLLTREDETTPTGVLNFGVVTPAADPLVLGGRGR